MSEKTLREKALESWLGYIQAKHGISEELAKLIFEDAEKEAKECQ